MATVIRLTGIAAAFAAMSWPTLLWAAGPERSAPEQLAAFLESSLAGGSVWLALGAAWVGGLLTALTPCVYPLIPITMRFFGAMREKRARVVKLALLYVAGMTVLYAGLGTLFASLNVVFGSYLSSPWVVGAIALFCAVMGASMLGAFTLQLPTSFNTRLSQIGGHGAGGAFLMGLVSGLIAAPCTGPVLAVILALVATSGEVLLGFGLMVSFSLGLGVPFLFLAIFSGALSRIPSGGVWSEAVKTLLATAMFVVAIYFLRFAWDGLARGLDGAPGGPWLAIPLVVAGLVAVALALRTADSLLGKLARAGGVLLLTGGVTVFFFAAPEPAAAEAASIGDTGADTGDPRTAAPAVDLTGRARAIEWHHDHETAAAAARQAGKPLLVHFTARWCLACLELEKKTFPDLEVRRLAERFVAVKIDATQETIAIKMLYRRYGIVGLPADVFVDCAGEVIERPRVTGFIPAASYAATLREVLAKGCGAES